MWSKLNEKWQHHQLEQTLGLSLYCFLSAQLKYEEILALKQKVENYSDEQLFDIIYRCYFKRHPEQEMALWVMEQRKSKN